MYVHVCTFRDWYTSWVATLPLFLCTEVVIGFERTTFTVDEDDDVVRVCARVLDGRIAKDVEVTFTSGDPGTATGKSIYISYLHMPFFPLPTFYIASVLCSACNIHL